MISANSRQQGNDKTMHQLKDISRMVAPNRGWRTALLILAFVFIAIVFPMLMLLALNLGEDKSLPPTLSACDNVPMGDDVASDAQPTDMQLSKFEQTVLDFNDWFSTNYDYTITCAGFGEIDWADFSSKLDLVTQELNLTEDDTKNGTFESFNSVDIERVIWNAQCLMNETNRLCGFLE